MSSTLTSNETERKPEGVEGSAPDGSVKRFLLESDLETPWYKSLVQNLRDAFNPPAPMVVTSAPDPNATLGSLDKVEIPWYKSLYANLHDTFFPPKLPPLELTSAPGEVKQIWGAYRGGESRSGLVSLIAHVGLVAILLTLFHPSVRHVIQKVVTPIYVQQYQAKLPKAAEKAGGGGGGGQHAPTPAARGEAPKMAKKVFVPPTQAIPQPKLPVVPTITAPAPPILADNYNDPMSKLNSNSGGQGAHGFGSGDGGGIGSGHGDGLGPGEGGGTGGGVYHPGGDVSSPELILKTSPEYSEEARKAKFSGVVMLSIVVDENGIPRDIKVVRPLGMGLDEKAIEAVSHWRFRPGAKGGKPVKVSATVEVTFRLL